MLQSKVFRNIRINYRIVSHFQWRPYSAAGCSHLKERILDEKMKIEIESHWRNRLSFKEFDKTNVKDKMYVLSMFPYPSGSLHMGHVRVYSISDAIARFYRLRGKNVFHPMGFDSFGLPAENAAIQRQIPAESWTLQNVSHMREQLKELGCSFDWSAELMTSDPNYYKWTQKLFLMLFKDGLAYQCESLVNWDPVDKTVLADEQVDENGCSWRSGAKVEKRLLKQWFVRTTQFAEKLYAGLDDPILEEWRDIINLQKHWIGECDGYSFKLKLDDTDSHKSLTVWSNQPEDFKSASFIAIKKEHLLNCDKITEGLLECRAMNPFNETSLPIVVTSEVEFPSFNDVHLGVPAKNQLDEDLAMKYNIEFSREFASEEVRPSIVKKAQELGIGGDFKISSKLKDWLISRQRFWGTPIPIVHCDTCGPVPVNEGDLPIELPKVANGKTVPLNQNEEWLTCECPKCGKEGARRETDTMDTFVDSSWYFLRYLDAQNTSDLADKNLGKAMMPVDLYIGGKEHAVLHLYYARFVNYYLHQKGYVSHPEPFKRLLVQGMVKGKSYRAKDTGQYLTLSEVDVVNEKKGKAFVKGTKRPVEILWEKMSKSKFNGVDPVDVIKEHGCDTTRLIMLGDVAPTSHRNWSEATFPGIINWQKRLWMTLHDFHVVREKVNEMAKSSQFEDHEEKLLDSANYFASGVNFNFSVSHQLSVGISKMQGLTNSIRRAPPDVVALGEQYERALSAQIIMLAPIAPHFASELWTRFVSAPNRVAQKSNYIDWDADVFHQKWPSVDAHHKIDFSVKVNNHFVHKFKVPCGKVNTMSREDATNIALDHESTIKYLKQKPVISSHWQVFEDYEGILNLIVEQHVSENKNNESDEKILLKQ